MATRSRVALSAISRSAAAVVAPAGVGFRATGAVADGAISVIERGAASGTVVQAESALPARARLNSPALLRN